MPLAVPALQSALEQLAAHPPATSAQCAQAWANAMQSYAAGIVPASVTVAAASATLAGALTSAFGAPAAAPGMESAFAAFAVTVGGGMAGFVPTLPAGPVGFAAQFSGPKPATHVAAAQALANRIHTWMSTGVATLAVPPNTPVPWS